MDTTTARALDTATARALDRIECFNHHWTPWKRAIEMIGDGWERLRRVYYYRSCKDCSAYEERG